MRHMDRERGGGGGMRHMDRERDRRGWGPRMEAADGYRTSSYCYNYKMFIVKSIVT